ncbi:MAG: hypothetical protein Q4C68_06765 [Moraxella sp.]|nr:hypothetical protein [Moraxella sp.]
MYLWAKIAFTTSVVGVIMTGCQSTNNIAPQPMASNNQGVLFQGASISYDADGVLRNDVIQQIDMIEKNYYGCPAISSVKANVIGAVDQAGVVHVQELWQVSACQQNHAYTIEFTPNPNGGTDFSVSFER